MCFSCLCFGEHGILLRVKRTRDKKTGIHTEAFGVFRRVVIGGVELHPPIRKASFGRSYPAVPGPCRQQMCLGVEMQDLGMGLIPKDELLRLSGIPHNPNRSQSLSFVLAFVLGE